MPRRNRTTRFSIIAAACVFAAAAWFWRGTVFRPFAGALLAAAAPFHAAGTRLRLATDLLVGRKNSEDLQAQNEALRLKNAELKTLAAENEALKKALDFTEREKDRGLAARVISEGSGSFHGLIIDRGLKDGLITGLPVVANGVLVGRVFDVGPWTSSVMSLTDPNSKIAVTVLNAQSTLAVLEGDRGLAMRMTLIPQTEELAVGDQVITSGIEPSIRRGLVVGTIGAIEKNTREPFQSAAVIPFVSTSHPIFVQVLLPQLAEDASN